LIDIDQVWLRLKSQNAGRQPTGSMQPVGTHRLRAGYPRKASEHLRKASTTRTDIKTARAYHDVCIVVHSERELPCLCRSVQTEHEVSMLKNISLSAKLALILVCPVLGFLWLASLYIADSYGTLKQMEDTVEASVAAQT